MHFLDMSPHVICHRLEDLPTEQAFPFLFENWQKQSIKKQLCRLIWGYRASSLRSSPNSTPSLISLSSWDRSPSRISMYLGSSRISVSVLDSTSSARLSFCKHLSKYYLVPDIIPKHIPNMKMIRRSMNNRFILIYRRNRHEYWWSIN